MRHALDRPVWNALTTRQAYLARGDAATALRFDPEYALFAASRTPDDLSGVAALIPPGAPIALVERHPCEPPPGTALAFHRPLLQMVAARIAPDTVAFAVTPLSDDDAPEMLALAQLTEPGPFFAKTNRLGDFVGVRQHGKLVAMAGERMKLDGHTEVSGVCTHPDHRGKGYAGGLMRIVAARIAARGETPFLHAWADNHGAIALYEALGYRPRAELVITALTRQS